MRTCLPMPALSIVENMMGCTYRDAVLSWWKYNGETEFFGHAEQARRVRSAIKNV